jgi:ribosomal protein L37AE/L43A
MNNKVFKVDEFIDDSQYFIEAEFGVSSKESDALTAEFFKQLEVIGIDKIVSVKRTLKSIYKDSLNEYFKCTDCGDLVMIYEGVNRIKVCNRCNSLSLGHSIGDNTEKNAILKALYKIKTENKGLIGKIEEFVFLYL